MRAIHQASRETNAFCHDLEIAVLGWSTRNDAPEAWMIATYDREGCGLLSILPSYSPLEAQQTLTMWAAPSLDIERVRTRLGPMTCEDNITPELFGTEVFEAMRAQKHDAPGNLTIHGVAGFVEMAEVTRTSVTKRVLKRWPDRPGRYVTPELTAMASNCSGSASMDDITDGFARQPRECADGPARWPPRS